MALAAIVWPGVHPLLKAAAVAGVLLLAWWLPRWARAPHAWGEAAGFTGKLAKVRDAFAESTRHARFGWLGRSPTGRSSWPPKPGCWRH